MKLIIDELYFIDVDTLGNHTLIKRGVFKEGNNIGKAKETTIGYYRDIPSAITKYLSLEAIDNVEVATLSEYIDRYEKAVERVITNLQGKVCKKKP